MLQQLLVEDVVAPLVIDHFVSLELDAFLEAWVRRSGRDCCQLTTDCSKLTIDTVHLPAYRDGDLANGRLDDADISSERQPSGC